MFLWVSQEDIMNNENKLYGMLEGMKCYGEKVEQGRGD